MNITVSLQNAAPIVQMANNMPNKITAALSDRVEAAMRVIQRETMVNAPVDTGKLRQSVKFKKTGQLTGEVEVGVKYGIYVHEGTRYYKGNPFMDRALGIAAPRIIKDFGLALQTTLRE